MIYLLLAGYAFLLCVLGLLFYKQHDAEDFFIASRNRPGWQLLLSKFAGSVGATVFITYTSYAYEFGTDIYIILIGSIVGYTLFGYVAAPKIWEAAQKTTMYTQGDFVFHQLQHVGAKNLSNAFSMLTQFFFLMISVVGGAKIISHFELLSYSSAVLITGAIILIYLLLAGYKAVIITDVIQSIIILTLLAGLSYSILQEASLSPLFDIQTDSLSTGAFVGFIIYGMLSVFSYADRYQLCFAAKNKKSLQRGLTLAIIPILIVASFLLFLGLYLYHHNPNLDPNAAFISILDLFISPALLPFGLILFFAGIMSSADTNIFAIASHLHFWKPHRHHPTQLRVLTAIIIILTSIAALFMDNIVDLTVIAAASSIILSVPMIYLICSKKNTDRFIGSVWGGFLGFMLGMFIRGIDPSLILIVALGGLFGLLYQKRNPPLPIQPSS